MFIRIAFLMVVVASLLTTGCGRTVPGTALGDGRAVFEALDVNGDGRLNREEAGVPGFQFDLLDGNDDGVLGFIEWSATRNDGDLALRIQLQRETIRDTASDPHKSGSTVRGAN